MTRERVPLKTLHRNEDFQLTKRRFATIWTKGDKYDPNNTFIFKGNMLLGDKRAIPNNTPVYRIGCYA